MALRGQPYIPLYVQDFMTDEKLNECSAESTGVYIRIMCVMHKSEKYGTILLRQKDQQSDSKIKNFAFKLMKQMPYQVDVIERSLQELIEEGVLTVDGDVLYQKRMVKDGNLSDIRACAGSKGAATTNEAYFATAKQAANKAAKVSANAEYESEGEVETVIDIKNVTKKKGVKGENKHKYGLYKNVLLTDTELAALQTEYADYADRIDRLSEYIESKGAKYKNHLATIRSWARKDIESGRVNNGRTGSSNRKSQFADLSNII
jgi:uncharacterized protein YdaU (DUF1376 family)